MKPDALKNAVAIAKGQKRTPSIIRVIKLMDEQDAERLARIEKAEAEKLVLIEVAVERGKRVAKAEKQAEAIGEVVGHTRFLYADRKAQKNRRSKAGKKTQRDTKDSGLWDRYEAFRAMRAKIERGEKQLAAATDVKAASKGNITIKPEALVRYYRAWMKKRKTD